MHEVVEGIILETRTCKRCTNTFKVFPSHPQIFCSEICEGANRKGFGKKKEYKKKRVLKHSIKESDYEKS